MTQSVERWKNGYWVVQHEPRHIQDSGVQFDEATTGKVIRGQSWATGPGITIILGLDWSQVAGSDVDVDVAYAETLVGSGRIGQALLVNGQHDGLEARMTPAVHESTVGAIFRFPPHIAGISAIRLARPAG